MVQALLQEQRGTPNERRTEPMTPPPAEQPASLELIVYQLSEMRQRLDQMTARLDQLTFVHEKTYAADRAADARVAANDRKVIDDYAAETRKIAENARTVAWTVATFFVAGFGLILALIKAVAG